MNFSVPGNRTNRHSGKWTDLEGLGNFLLAGIRLALCCALLTSAAFAQADQKLSGEAFKAARIREYLPQALDALKRGNLAEADFSIIADAGAVQAIPDLKKQFALTKSPVYKLSIVTALVKLGAKDPAWWDYLAGKAEDAINSDAPYLQDFDKDGRVVAGLSPKFLAWAKAHSLTEDAATEEEQHHFQAAVSLGMSGDRRAIPLLRQALLSPDYMVEAAAAIGLAQLQDKASIPLLIEACEEAPADVAFAIARALLDFDTPEAQSATHRFRPPQPPR